MKLSNWLLFGTGQAILIGLLLLICLAATAGAIYVGASIDEHRIEPVKQKVEYLHVQHINEPALMLFTGLGLVGIARIGKKQIK